MIGFYLGGITLLALSVIFAMVAQARVATQEAEASKRNGLAFLHGRIGDAAKGSAAQHGRIMTDPRARPFVVLAGLCAAAGFLCVWSGPAMFDWFAT